MLSKLLTSLQDNDGTLNPAHVVAFALTGAAITWVSFLVYKNHTLPDLNGIAWLLGGSGAVNIAHKAEEMVAALRKN
jgi:hypothetical protein